MSVRFLPAGDTGLVVEFGSSVDRALSNRVLALSESLEAANIAGVVELVPTFRSLLIHYDPRLTSGASLEDGLRSRIAQHGGSGRHGRLWHVPACYDKKYAPDIAEVAERAGLTIAEVTERHSATQYHVYMIGFVPGLPYMGDTVPELNLPRRVNPRVRVPPGSIAIAIGQTIIYPVESPGGWHLIGSTPISLFDPSRPQPALFAPGDAVKFESLSVEDYEAVSRDVAAGRYELRCEEIGR
jgi:inhibitor of KinA